MAQTEIGRGEQHVAKDEKIVGNDTLPQNRRKSSAPKPPLVYATKDRFWNKIQNGLADERAALWDMISRPYVDAKKSLRDVERAQEKFRVTITDSLGKLNEKNVPQTISEIVEEVIKLSPNWWNRSEKALVKQFAKNFRIRDVGVWIRNLEEINQSLHEAFPLDVAKHEKNTERLSALHHEVRNVLPKLEADQPIYQDRRNDLRRAELNFSTGKKVLLFTFNSEYRQQAMVDYAKRHFFNKKKVQEVVRSPVNVAANSAPVGMPVVTATTIAPAKQTPSKPQSAELAVAPSATDISELVLQMSAETVGFVTVNPETPAVALPRTDGVLEPVPHDYGSPHVNFWTKLSTQLRAPQFKKRNLAVGGSLLAGLGVALMAVGGFANKNPTASSAGPVRAAAAARPTAPVAVQPQSNEVVMPAQDAAAPAVAEVKPSALIKIIRDDKVSQITLENGVIHQPSRRRLASHGWRLFSDKCAWTLSELSVSGVQSMLKDANSRKDFENGIIDEMKTNGTREEHQLAFRVEAAMSNARNSVLVSRNNQKSPGPIPGY